RLPPRRWGTPTRRTRGSRSAPLGSSTTGASSAGATSRTRRTGSGCAPSAAWSRRCTRPAAARSSPSSPSTSTAPGSCTPAAAVRGERPGPVVRYGYLRPPDVRVAAGRVRAGRPGGAGVSEPYAAVDVIIAKRDRGELADEQIDWVVDAYTRGVVADEQMSA